MNRLVRSSEPASDELTQAVRWYEVAKPALVVIFDVVAVTVALIEANPEIGTTIPRTHGHTTAARW